ncbi:MAG: CDP-glucose 4,6-dehydratase, partial [Proteobacteria bacterium]|nr:CDP-glucose 4,6-dehydratase [Pseudomonadota bacterium]
MANPEFWQGRRVLLTGHTGFKGGWAALWLARLGAEVHGLSLEPESEPNLFAILGDWSAISSRIGDIRDRETLRRTVADARPEIVIHMAAQALVRRSYREPGETTDTNVMGTVNLLDALRGADGLMAVLVVTSDKVYENREDGHAMSETDPLGGDDPYSASKAAAEIVTAAMTRSFFEEYGVPVATARSGNVIGGGDFSEDRLVPDLWRAGRASRPLVLRYPLATRPWQHVLDPVNGYLAYIEKLAAGACDRRALNFGPDNAETMTVAAVAEQMMEHLGMEHTWEQDTGKHPKEKQTLTLDASLAADAIGWRPALS